MLIYIIVGSVRENRTAIKVANWLHQEIGNFSVPPKNHLILPG